MRRGEALAGLLQVLSATPQLFSRVRSAQARRTEPIRQFLEGRFEITTSLTS
jgi:hypothetical protein